MDAHVDYLELVAHLRRLVQEGTSATLRIVTDDRHFVNIGLETGRIVSIHHGPRHGLKALRLVTGLSGGALSLLPPHELQPQQDLPPTQEILRILDEGEMYRIQDQDQPFRPEPSTLAGQASEAPSGQSTADLTSRELAHQLVCMEEELLHVIGPIAKVVVKDGIQELGGVHSRADLLQLAKILSREIEQPDQARGFVERLRERL